MKDQPFKFVWHACRADEVKAQIKSLQAQLSPHTTQIREFEQVRDALEALTFNDWPLPPDADERLKKMADQIDSAMGRTALYEFNRK